jgi:hypothetical protein
MDPQLGAGFTTCEYPCQTDADCTNPAERCQAGFCTINECGQLDGGNGTIWSTCDAADAGDGTCALPAGPQADLITPLFDFFPAVFVCVVDGTSTDSCDLLATRAPADAARRCAAGLVCNPDIVGVDGGSGGTCVHGCDPSAPDCPAGQVCTGNVARDGYCYPAGNGGCATGLPDDTYAFCDNNAQCSCPNLCVFDPGMDAGTFCEPPCATPADCPYAGTTCVAGSCVVNFCQQSVGGPAPGAYGEPCTSVSGDDGTCLPTLALGQSVGVCMRAGTASAGCSYVFDYASVVPAGRILSADQLCPSGQVCSFPSDGGAGACAILCTPSDAGCPQGMVCLEQDSLIPNFGLCGACITSGGFCLNDWECCAGTCGSDAGRFVCP